MNMLKNGRSLVSSICPLETGTSHAKADSRLTWLDETDLLKLNITHSAVPAHVSTNSGRVMSKAAAHSQYRREGVRGT
jgi:hypothetical protein